MNQLTVRGFDDELNDHLQRLARREGISLNKAALKLLRKGAGLTGDAGDDRTIGSSLDFFHRFLHRGRGGRVGRRAGGTPDHR